MYDNTPKSTLLEKLVAPILVGLVVLGGQWFVQPMIMKTGTQKVELLRSKQEVYANALDLVIQFHRSFPWRDEQGAPRNPKVGPPVQMESLYQCLGRILIVEDSRAVSDAFLQCFGVTNKIVASDYPIRLIEAMRSDLYGLNNKGRRSAIPIYIDIESIAEKDTGPILSRSVDGKKLAEPTNAPYSQPQTVEKR